MNVTNYPGKCQTIVHRRHSVGIMGKGTESYTSAPGWCSRNAVEGDTVCKIHRQEADRIAAELARRSNS